MPLVTGTRSPRLWARLPRPRAPALAVGPPFLTSALAPEAAAFSAATVLRPTVPLGVSWAAFWKRLTALTVEGPNCPSTRTLKPALRSARCSSRTSVPLAPARRARSPRCVPVARLATAAGALTTPQHTAAATSDRTKRRNDGGTTAGTPFFGRLRGELSGSREKGRATPSEDGDSPLTTVMVSGSPASFRWGRKEFGWSQRPEQHTEVVGGYAFCPVLRLSIPTKTRWERIFRAPESGAPIGVS